MIPLVLIIVAASIYLVRYMNIRREQRNYDRTERHRRLMEETMFRIRAANREQHKKTEDKDGPAPAGENNG